MLSYLNIPLNEDPVEFFLQNIICLGIKLISLYRFYFIIYGYALLKLWMYV